MAEKVVRGKIISSDGKVLAQTLTENGSEIRDYPYGRMFAHVVGYNDKGKSGLESVCNFDLLKSDANLMTQITSSLKGEKSIGDNVYTTLNTKVQKAAYYALQGQKGAVVAMDPETGKIYAMVSKPDYRPAYVKENWTELNTSKNSLLLNRATQGLYPPGSTFKVVTALEYMREHKNTYKNFKYHCTGYTTVGTLKIHCYGGEAHGTVNLEQAIEKSCNCAFAEIGTQLGGAALLKTSEDLLFNQKLPLRSYRKSSFTLNGSSGVPLTMQTAIGQGNTLVSPMHMALITSSIANGGVLMKPYLIDKVQNHAGDEVDITEPEAYKRLMTDNEASLLGELMKGVVQNGTASSLNGRGYTVAGKTGSAEYNESGASHSWFVGYSNVDNPDIVVSVIVEDGGTGSEAAVPIAADVFDAYYFD